MKKLTFRSLPFETLTFDTLPFLHILTFNTLISNTLTNDTYDFLQGKPKNERHSVNILFHPNYDNPTEKFEIIKKGIKSIYVFIFFRINSRIWMDPPLIHLMVKITKPGLVCLWHVQET